MVSWSRKSLLVLWGGETWATSYVRRMLGLGDRVLLGRCLGGPAVVRRGGCNPAGD